MSDPKDSAEPVFRILTHKGLTPGYGTKVFAFGQELHGVEKIQHSTQYNGADDVVRTTITMTIFGAQVVTDFVDG